MKKTSIVAVLVVLLATACSSPPAGAPPDLDLELGARLFAAIQANDWVAFEPLTITSADFTLKRMNLSPLQAKQSYVGASLRPTLIAKLHADFDRAAAGGSGQIDFRRAHFVGLGPVTASGNLPDVQGAAIPYQTYSLKIDFEGRVLDATDLTPRFTIVPWENGRRLLKMEF